MCIDKFHNCKYCGNNYSCNLSNDACPTINFDDDKCLCPMCRHVLNDLIKNELIEMKNWKIELPKFVR